MGLFDKGNVYVFDEFFNFILIGFFKKDGKVKKGKHIDHNYHMKLYFKSSLK